MRILPSITTIFDWRGKAEEVRKLKLKEVALFLTCVDFKERQELFRLLRKTAIREIPFVHLRSDNKAQELDYLIKNYHTEAFNMHTKREYAYFLDHKKYRHMTHIENTYYPFDEKEIKEFAGICLDLAHLENSRIFRPGMYRHNIKMVDKYSCGCNHIGPAKNYSFFDNKGEVIYSEDSHGHIMKDLSELDYLKRYPLGYFSEYAALEMENSIKEQLEAKKYIVKLLGI